VKSRSCRAGTRALALASLVLASLGASCSNAAPAPADAGSRDAATDASSPGEASVRLRPADLTTAVRDEPVQLVIEGAPDATGRLAASVERMIDLQTWPEGDPVAFGTSRSGEAGTATRFVDISPTGALASRWHLLRVRGQSVSAIFHPDSAPVLRNVALCRKSDPASVTATVELSEVVATDGVASRMTVADKASAATCSLGVVAAYASSLPFQCPLATGRVLAFAMKQGIVSPRGTSVGRINRAAGASADVVEQGDLTVDIDLEKEPETAGCRAFAF